MLSLYSFISDPWTRDALIWYLKIHAAVRFVKLDVFVSLVADDDVKSFFVARMDERRIFAIEERFIRLVQGGLPENIHVHFQVHREFFAVYHLVLREHQGFDRNAAVSQWGVHIKLDVGWFYMCHKII